MNLIFFSFIFKNLKKLLCFKTKHLIKHKKIIETLCLKFAIIAQTYFSQCASK